MEDAAAAAATPTLTDMLELTERVDRLEESVRLFGTLRVLDRPSDLYEERIDYSNAVIHQWNDMKVILNNDTEKKPFILNTVIFHENIIRLAYGGYKSEVIPFTRCTKLSFIGSGWASSEYFEKVD